MIDITTKERARELDIGKERESRGESEREVETDRKIFVTKSLCLCVCIGVTLFCVYVKNYSTGYMSIYWLWKHTHSCLHVATAACYLLPGYRIVVTLYVRDEPLPLTLPF